jgi:hypothetical protein
MELSVPERPFWELATPLRRQRHALHLVPERPARAEVGVRGRPPRAHQPHPSPPLPRGVVARARRVARPRGAARSAQGAGEGRRPLSAELSGHHQPVGRAHTLASCRPPPSAPTRNSGGWRRAHPWRQAQIAVDSPPAASDPACIRSPPHPPTVQGTTLTGARRRHAAAARRRGESASVHPHEHRWPNSGSRSSHSSASAAATSNDM